MKSLSLFRLKIFFISTFFVTAFAEGSPTDVLQENLYLQIQTDLKQKQLNKSMLSDWTKINIECDADEAPCMTSLEIIIQSLDDVLSSAHSQEKEDVKNKIRSTLAHLRTEADNLGDLLNLYVLYKRAEGSFDTPWYLRAQEMQLTRRDGRPDIKAHYTIQAHPEYFKSKRWLFIIRELRNLFGKNKSDSTYITDHLEPISKSAVKDLVNTDPPIHLYYSGKYYNQPRVFMFCRENRKYPCRYIIKDKSGKWRRTAQQTVWSQRSLGLSRLKRSFNQSNGNTPSGVYRIDGVMPTNDDQTSFGQYRRLILNFVGSSENEENLKKLIPTSSFQEKWWTESAIARDLGRGLFRIHGTGRKSSSTKSYYPLTPTLGCVAQSENTYNGITYKDQRNFLDELMLASGLEPTYENEEKILGLLYVVNINNEKRPVELADLLKLGVIR